MSLIFPGDYYSLLLLILFNIELEKKYRPYEKVTLNCRCILHIEMSQHPSERILVHTDTSNNRAGRLQNLTNSRQQEPLVRPDTVKCAARRCSPLHHPPVSRLVPRAKLSLSRRGGRFFKKVKKFGIIVLFICQIMGYRKFLSPVELCLPSYNSVCKLK